jgi:hypothetical protein
VVAPGGKRGREHGVVLIKRGTLKQTKRGGSISRRSDGTGGLSVAGAVFIFLKCLVFKKTKRKKEIVSSNDSAFWI